MGITLVDHVDPVSHFLHFNLLNAPVQVNVVWDMMRIKKMISIGGMVKDQNT